MENLVSLSYWFNPAPGPWLEVSLKIVYIFFSLLLLSGLVAWFFAGKNKGDKLMFKFWQKIQTAGLTIGGVGLILITLRQQGIYFLAMPFWLVVLLIILLVWIYFIIKYISRDVPQRREEIKQQQEKEKYLP